MRSILEQNGEFFIEFDMLAEMESALEQLFASGAVVIVAATRAFEDALFKDAYIYHINVDFVKDVALDWAILAPIRKQLEEKGFDVETPGFVEGRSGVRHMFDMIVYNHGKLGKIAINISTSTDGKPVSEQAARAQRYLKCKVTCAYEHRAWCPDEDSSKLDPKGVNYE